MQVVANRRHLSKAPITEAVIDLRVKFSEPPEMAVLSSLEQEFSDEFPVRKKQFQLQAEIKLDAGQFSGRGDRRERGLLLKSADESEVVQFRVDGFTYSRLRPYTSWEEIFPKAWRLWEAYRSKTSPESITRLATRYINRLEIQNPSTNLADYLETPPIVPEGIPNILKNFFIRFTLYDDETKANINLIQASEVSLDPMRAVILLDIDVYRDDGPFEDDSQIKNILGITGNQESSIF